jgi:hypothetical protein
MGRDGGSVRARPRARRIPGQFPNRVTTTRRHRRRGRTIPRLPSICRSYGASSRFGPTAIKISLLLS